MGRKCLLTKEVHNEIVEILEAGNYQKTAFESLGISEDTYYHWIRQGEKAENKTGSLTKTEEKYLKFAQAVKKAVQVARQRNLKVIQEATEGGAIISEMEYYDKKGNVTGKKTVYSAPSWQAAAWFLERTSPNEFGHKVKQEIDLPKDITLRVVYDDQSSRKNN